MSAPRTSQTATVRKPFGGERLKATYKVGEKVRVIEIGTGLFLVERMEWIAPKVAAMNQCSGVPSDCLEFTA